MRTFSSQAGRIRLFRDAVRVAGFHMIVAEHRVTETVFVQRNELHAGESKSGDAIVKPIKTVANRNHVAGDEHSRLRDWEVNEAEKT